jgi:hypothetical protein
MKYRDRIGRFHKLVSGLVVVLSVSVLVWTLSNPVHYWQLRSWFVLNEEKLGENQLAMTTSTSPLVVITKAPSLRAPTLSPLFKQPVRFETTIRSCLGSYCMTEQFTDISSGEKIQRIGILLPDISLAQSPLWPIIRASVHNVHSTLLVSTHVPAYGYGKNHGWTRIVRIVDNLPTQAYRLMPPLQSTSSKQYQQLYANQVSDFLAFTVFVSNCTV